MGLTFRKRDDYDKLMDELGITTVDLVNLEDETTTKTGKKEDPFAKFLEKDEETTEDPFAKFLKTADEAENK
ncbi:hypothetical protein [Lactococcus sp.]|uniref:hypothetical protein n=1 Tax=Lactococcus sp. TaxID=44273 RepID=UPI0035B2BCC3